ncbi:hypothetical protein PLICRDRAFT_37059 [Plicaturopsis crispa FD-325 SS-3]|nr:hypothetical protein PLICRDRAFT_37059 [Plicaturopsis crispa FD-325 SS-3]
MSKAIDTGRIPAQGGVKRRSLFLAIGITTVFVWNAIHLLRLTGPTSHVPLHAQEILRKCDALDAQPGPPSDFHLRTSSDRFAKGTKATLIRNASIWTGHIEGDGEGLVIHGDLLLDKGLIKAVGAISAQTLAAYDDSELITHDAAGAWVTPGIVDLHSHLGVDSAPELRGASDTNSIKGLILPWLRSADGLNTHDAAYELSVSGGVTTANVLPGSADAIGGQAFTIKLRPTAERSTTALLLEPPWNLGGNGTDSPPRWRQMKHACGENPSRVYSGTRMDTIWAFREGYETARKIKTSQDNYCARARTGAWENLGAFPEDLQWEALVDVLRGHVKVHVHCYEAVDLDGLVRLSNEFQFPIAAFHHAHETYLVPDLLKRAYGGAPAVALFATNARYKREAYRGSEFAPRVLADAGLRVVMKSDHPVLNSRHLLYEAQQAHHYGLHSDLALAAVTSTPATVLGLGHRIGFVQEGHDADIVLWDSHPLSLGAAPQQVWIDGISQIAKPHVSPKPSAFQHAPETPNYDSETSATLKHDGLPPLTPAKAVERVVFRNIGSVYTRTEGGISELALPESVGAAGNVVVVDRGVILCAGSEDTCAASASEAGLESVDLAGGSIAPALISFGSPLGLEEIQGEASTRDGVALDGLSSASLSPLLPPLVHAVDGLVFSTRDALLAHRSGVTSGVAVPNGKGLIAGRASVFSTGAPHKLAPGAVRQDFAGFHVSIGHTRSGVPSVSTQIAALRHLLQNDTAFADVVEGKTPLVVEVYSADIIASLILLKNEVEAAHGGLPIKLTIAGAAEAHLLAKEIGAADIGVIIAPSRPFPGTWESRRILPGPPLSSQNAIATLIAENVTVGVGIEEQWSARHTRFDIAWAALESSGAISKTQALALASVNLEKLLGVDEAEFGDLVATAHGDLLSLQSKVVGVISPSRGVVDLF